MSESIASTFGLTIAARRRDLGVTQEDLAAITGLSARAIGQIELGQTNPRLSSLHAVLTALGLELTITAREPHATPAGAE